MFRAHDPVARGILTAMFVLTHVFIACVMPGNCALVTQQAIEVLAADGARDDYFGLSVDIDGNSMVVGAYYADAEKLDSGAAYIFRRNHLSADGWEQVAKLVPPLPYYYDNFGVSVAISGDTVVVGTMESYGGGTVYVFERNQGGVDAWGLTSTLVGADSEEDDSFGRAVAVDGETIVVGAPFDDDDGSSSGSAYVFHRNPNLAEGWEQVKKLTASDAAANEWFGFSIGVSGDTVVIGCQWDSVTAARAGAAYVYERNQGGIADGWGEVAKLVANDPAEWDMFGRSVAIDGGIVVVGTERDDDQADNAGAAYIFERNNGGADSWGLLQKITANNAAEEDHFGSAVAIFDSTVVVGAPDRNTADTFINGAIYVFERNHGAVGGWGEVMNFEVDGSQEFGTSVAIEGTFIAVGEIGDDTTDINAGSAWVLLRNGDLWLQEASARALDGADDDRFGSAVGISGDTAVVGAANDDDGATDSGSAYILERNEGGQNVWQQVAKVVAPDPSEGAGFGRATDISGGTAIVGAPEDDEAASGAGAAYVYVRNDLGADDWGMVRKLLPVFPPTDADFGSAVAIDRDTALVGASDDTGLAYRSGSVSVFQRNEGGLEEWGFVTELVPTDPANQDYFGYSVALDGDIAVVGAFGNDDLGSLTGSAYIFFRHQGGRNAWGQVAKLVGHEAGEHFGSSVAVAGSLVVVGAPLNDQLALNAGAAYVYERNQGGIADGWGLVATLTAGVDAGGSAIFGDQVSIAGTRVVVGSPADQTNGTTQTGSAYIFEQNQGGSDAWGRIAKVFPRYGASNYGNALAMTATELIGGGQWASYYTTTGGRAFVHRLTAPEADLAVSKSDGTDVVTTPGTIITYDIEVSNAGPDAVAGATMVDEMNTLLFNTAGVSWTCSPNGGAGPATNCPASGDASDLAAGVAVDLESGDSVTFVVSAPVLLTAAGDLVNTATVEVPSNYYDSNLGNNSSTDTNVLRELDFGDAPDPTYPTLSASDGACHGVDTVLRLGSNADGEFDGQPNASATGDDDDGGNDDDGVVFRSKLTPGRTTAVDVESGGAAVVNGWIDFNIDGDWDDAGEKVLADQAVSAGVQRLNISVPGDATLGSTFARFRLSSSAGLEPTGLAVDGEVEDYTVEIVAAAVEPLRAFSATAHGTNVTLTWANPEVGYGSTVVRVSTSGFPAGPEDGSLLVNDTGSAGGVATFTYSGLMVGKVQYYSAFVFDGAASYSVARTVSTRPFTSGEKVQWIYTTGASALAPSAPLPGIGHFTVSNDRMLHALTAGPAGGLWPSGWIPPSLNGPAQARGPVVELPTTRIHGADTVSLVGSQDGHVYAFDATTGIRLWSSSEFSGEIQAAPSLCLVDFGAEFDLVVAAVRNAAGDSKVVGLDLFDGSVAWEFDNGGGAGAVGVISSQVSVDTTTSPPQAFFASRRHPTGSSSTLWCITFTEQGASKKWSVDIGDIDGSPILRNGLLYVGNNAGEVYARYSGSGGAAWPAPYSTGDGPVKDFVWVGSGTSRLYFSTTTKVHAITDNGVGSAPTAYWLAPVTVAGGPSCPLLAAGRLYVGSGEGELVEMYADVPDPTPVILSLGDPNAVFTVGSPSFDWVHSHVVVGASTGEVFAVATPIGGAR